MLSIQVIKNIVGGSHSGKTKPEGNIEVTQEMLDVVESLRRRADSEGRYSPVYWNDGIPTLDTDTRPVVNVKINGSSNNTVVLVGTPFDVELSVDGFEGKLVIPVFDRRFLFEFTNGVANKTITAIESKLYEVKSNDQFKVANSIVIDAVE